ncbi:crotonase/enoyl-CoA hydratase family protein [Thermodesulfobacteriota bacterium]
MAVTIKKKGFITSVIISRPDVRNAVDIKTAEALADAFRDFEEDEEARVAILYGEHGQFCAGADLKEFSKGIRTLPDAKGDGPMGPTRMCLNKPVIAAIAGYAVAGGLELALWCDLRVMEEDGVLGVFCRRWGVPLVDGGTIRLPRLIGLSRALDLILTGRPVGAQEALDMGLVNRVVPRGEVRQAAEELAQQIGSFPQVCLRGDRMSAYEQFDMSMEQALVNELKHGTAAIQQEAVGGATRFSEGEGRHGRFE